MRRGCWVGDERLGISEVVGNVDEAQRVQKTKARLLAAGHVKADEAASVFHLPTRELVLRVARQAGVEYAGNFWVALQIAGDRGGGAALPFDAQLEGLEPFQQQPGVERAQRRPGMPVKRAEIVLDEFFRGEDRAAEA